LEKKLLKIKILISATCKSAAVIREKRNIEKHQRFLINVNHSGNRLLDRTSRIREHTTQQLHCVGWLHRWYFLNLSLGTCSFICQVPRPGDSEWTFSDFESSCHLLLPI